MHFHIEIETHVKPFLSYLCHLKIIYKKRKKDMDSEEKKERYGQ